jgi:spore cortex formation protein SpoVR/YcgB (stage V sporulation)
MKTRQGFVSNSSSTSFVVALSRDFVITDEAVSKFIDAYKNYDNKRVTPEGSREKIEYAVDKLCGDGIVYAVDADDENDVCFVVEFLTELYPDILLAEIDTSSEMGCCVNILSDKSKKETLRKLNRIVDKG